MNGKAMNSAAQLRNAVGLRKVGDKVTLKLIRDGEVEKLSAKIGEPSDQKLAVTGVSQFLEGARLETSTDPDGVLVEAIEPGTPAQASGLRPGDVITSINKQTVASINDLKRVIKDKNQQLLLRIWRGGAAFYLVLR